MTQLAAATERGVDRLQEREVWAITDHVCASCGFEFPGSELPTHCTDCCRTWSSHVECHCAECHEHFSSEGAFDLHQTADECRDPAKVRRLSRVERKWGPCWVERTPYAAEDGICEAPTDRIGARVPGSNPDRDVASC